MIKPETILMNNLLIGSDPTKDAKREFDGSSKEITLYSTMMLYLYV